MVPYPISPHLWKRSSLHTKNTRSIPAGGEQSSELYEEVEVELPERCSGCGVRLQQDDANRPGYFQVPKRILEALSNPMGMEEEDLDDAWESQEDIGGEDLALQRGSSAVEEDDTWAEFDAIVESWMDEHDVQEDEEIGSSTSGQRGKTKKKRKDEAQPQSFLDDAMIEGDSTVEPLLEEILCTRCYSLRHYGRIKNVEAEESLPAFDFERLIGRRISLQKFRREIVLVVVDLADFDGSLPREAIRSLLPGEFRNSDDVTRRYPPGFRLVVAANKSDLLPRFATTARLEAWVRKRIAQGGLPRPSSVHIVSSINGSGIKALLADLQSAVGNRGDVWVVGAQNAGKSSLLNAMSKAVHLPSKRAVTAAHVPGTTLGMVRVPGLLPRGCKMLDTPGVPHGHQIVSVLSSEEMKLLLPKRPLAPRTYRLGEGQSVTIGGIARVDVVECPGPTLYLTVWVSDEVQCHLGKTENVDELLAKHQGTKLVPPVGDEARIKSFAPLQPTDVQVEARSWKKNELDVAIAGVGWIGVGLKGAAVLRTWAPQGVAITTREALIPDFAKEFQRPGFDIVAKGKAAKGGHDADRKTQKNKKMSERR